MAERSGRMPSIMTRAALRRLTDQSRTIAIVDLSGSTATPIAIIDLTNNENQSDEREGVLENTTGDAGAIATAPAQGSSPQEQKDDSYRCPICLDSVGLREPTAAKCGHVFCYICIYTALRMYHVCPLCNIKLPSHRSLRRIFL